MLSAGTAGAYEADATPGQPGKEAAGQGRGARLL